MEEHDPGSLADALKREAREIGFGLVGIASARGSEHIPFLRSWLDRDFHGSMGYLERPDAVARRADPSLTVADAASWLVVAHEYHQEDPAGVPRDPSRSVFARYARGEDYHDVMSRKLEHLLRWLDQRTPGGARGRPYVDTGPVLERELAQRSGLGWFGRNTMLINPERGSYFFLGVLLLDVELPPDPPFAEDRCGTCRACLDACPTGALLGRDDDGAPVIDARRCISYLTIELRTAIPVELRPLIGNRVFGCDICQEVCPWNERFARPAEETAYRSRREVDGPPLVELAERLLDAGGESLSHVFPRSAIRRAKRTGLLRNVCVALGNWGSAAALPALLRALEDGSPIVRAHAAWACGKVGGAMAREALERSLEVELDPDVARELSSALNELVEA